MSDKDLTILEETNSVDVRSKYFFSSKEVVGAILHYLVPGFENMTIKEIVKECIDPVNRDEAHMDILTAEVISPNYLKFIEDLVFMIKLPELLSEKEKSDYMLLHLEIQNQKVYYPLTKRINAYRSDLYQKESQFLDIKTTEKFYKDSIPVVSIWFLFNQNEGKTYTLNKPAIYLPPKKPGDKEAQQNTEDNFLPKNSEDSSLLENFVANYLLKNFGVNSLPENSEDNSLLENFVANYLLKNFGVDSLPENFKVSTLPEVIIVNIDEDIPPDEPIYGIIKDLVKGSEKEVKQTLDLVGAKKNKKGNIMVYDSLIRDVYQNGIAEGIEKGRIMGIEEGRIMGIKEGRIEGIKEGRIEGIEEGRMELKDKALELFNNGEIDEKYYDFFVSILNDKE